MKIEKFDILKSADRDEINLRSAELPENENNETLEHLGGANINEFAKEKIQSAENEVEEFAIEGRRQIDNIEQKIGLSNKDIASVREAAGLFRGIEKIQRKAEILIQKMKAKFFEPTVKEEREINPPIVEGEIFSPELELQEVRRAPKEERAQRLREYKEKLAYQKDGLAKMQEMIIETIRENPDAASEQLYELVRDAGSQYGLTDEQKTIAHELLQAYAEKHANVRAIREKYKDDGELYNAVFGKSPEGPIEVIEGPMTLYFRCKNIKDYAWIHSQSFLENPDSRDLTSHEMQAAAMSGGVSIRTSPVKGLEGVIIAENAEDDRDFLNPIKSKESQRILNHEEQHAIKLIFKDEAKKYSSWIKFKTAKSDQEREAIIKEYIQYTRKEYADDNAKDEILAYFKDGTPAADIFKELTKPKEEGGLYDYFKSNRMLSAIDVKFFGEEFRPAIVKMYSKVCGIEYQDLLHKSLHAILGLERSGYDKEEIIALLIQEPLTRWEKVTKRLTDKQK